MISLSRAASCASHLVRLKSSTTLETSCFGLCRSDTFSDLLRRSRSRWRSRSRSLATAFMRLERPSPASSIVMNRGSCNFEITKSIMDAPSKVEIDHFLHHEDAERHPGDAAHQHELTGGVGPKQRDVFGRRKVYQQHHDRRQRADDARGSLGFRRHRLDLLPHLLAVAQHLGEVAKGFREVTARLLLDRDHDAEEVRLG